MFCHSPSRHESAVYTNRLKKVLTSEKPRGLIFQNTFETINFCFLFYISIPQKKKKQKTISPLLSPPFLKIIPSSFLPYNTCQNSAQSEFLQPTQNPKIETADSSLNTVTLAGALVINSQASNLQNNKAMQIGACRKNNLKQMAKL